MRNPLWVGKTGCAPAASFLKLLSSAELHFRFRCYRTPRFKASPPAGLEPGSPFGANLRAFVLYLRFAQAIPCERLARLMSDLLGLEISEGALANMLQDSGDAFAHQSSMIRDRLLSGTILQSDETSARVGKTTWWTWAEPAFHRC